MGIDLKKVQNDTVSTENDILLLVKKINKKIREEEIIVQEHIKQLNALKKTEYDKKLKYFYPIQYICEQFFDNIEIVDDADFKTYKIVFNKLKDTWGLYHRFILFDTINNKIEFSYYKKYENQQSHITQRIELSLKDIEEDNTLTEDDFYDSFIKLFIEEFIGYIRKNESHIDYFKKILNYM